MCVRRTESKVMEISCWEKGIFFRGFIQYFPCIRGYILICTGDIYILGPQREGSDHGVNIEEENNDYVVFQWNILGSVAKFIVPAKFIGPDWRQNVDSVIGLSCRPVRLHRLSGRYDNPMLKSTMSPIQGLWIWLQLGRYVGWVGVRGDGATPHSPHFYSRGRILRRNWDKSLQSFLLLFADTST